MNALLAAGREIGFDDIALVIFFVIVAVLRMLQTLRKKRPPVAPPEEDRARPRAEETEEGAARRPPPERAHARPTPPPAPRPAPKAAHLAGLTGIARGERADLKRREAEPIPLHPAAPSGHVLLLANALPPKDRLRQAVAWSEILRRPRPMLPPPRTRPPAPPGPR